MEDIITDIDVATKRLDYNTKTKIRQQCIDVITKTRTINQPTTYHKTIKTLKEKDVLYMKQTKEMP